MDETISEAIGADHRAMDTYIDNIRNAKDLQTKTEWRNQLTWTLARHAISEELTLYPAMIKHMGQEGTDLTTVDRAQHQAVRRSSPVIEDRQLNLYRSKKTSTSSRACRLTIHSSRRSSIT